EEVEPLPSPAARAAAGPRATGLRPWRVGGLRVGLAAALPWLAGLAADESARPDGPALGAGLRFWARAAAFALDLLRAEQVAPPARPAPGRRPPGRRAPAAERPGRASPPARARRRDPAGGPGHGRRADRAAGGAARRLPARRRRRARARLAGGGDLAGGALAV